MEFWWLQCILAFSWLSAHALDLDIFLQESVLSVFGFKPPLFLTFFIYLNCVSFLPLSPHSWFSVGICWAAA